MAARPVAVKRARMVGSRARPMLAPDVTFEGFTAPDWERLLAAFTPRSRDADDGPEGGLVVLHDGERVRKLVHTRVGRLDPSGLAWPTSLPDLAERHGARFAVAADLDALDDVMHELGARLRRHDDALRQWTTLATIVRERLASGRLAAWPRRLRPVPIPTPRMVDAVLDSVCPVGRVALLGLFADGQLATSVAVLREARGLTRIVGPDAMRRRMGLCSGDFRRDYRHLVEVTARTIGPLSFGCFAEEATLRALSVDDTPGAWARAVAVRDVILAPMPAPLVVPLGLDAARAGIAALRDVLERADPIGSTFAGALLSRITPGANGPAPFDPLDALRRLLAR